MPSLHNKNKMAPPPSHFKNAKMKFSLEQIFIRSFERNIYFFVARNESCFRYFSLWHKLIRMEIYIYFFIINIQEALYFERFFRYYFTPNISIDLYRFSSISKILNHRYLLIPNTFISFSK